MRMQYKKHALSVISLALFTFTLIGCTNNEKKIIKKRHILLRLLKNVVMLLKKTIKFIT